MKAYLPFKHPWLSCVPQRIWWPQPEERLNQKKLEDRFTMAAIIRSVDNKTTVCNLAIPENSAAYSGISNSRKSKVTRRRQGSPLIQGRVKIPSYIRSLAMQHKRQTLCWRKYNQVELSRLLIRMVSF